MATAKEPDSTSSIIFRIGLATGGGTFLYAGTVFATAVSPANALLFVSCAILLGLAGFVGLFSAGLRQPPPQLRWLILAAYVAQVITQTAVRTQFPSATDRNLVDSGLYTDLAAALVRHGQNPYTWDYGGVFDLHRLPEMSSTPVLNGATESPYPYPALALLLIVPIQELGLPGIFSLSMVANVALLILIFAGSPRKWQPVILLPMFAGFDFTFLSTTGNLDVLWILALVGMVAAWRHSSLRALLYGLAISVKQGPALLVPFLLIHIWKESEAAAPISRVARFGATAAATFLVINGPFLVWNPIAWFNGYTEPARDALVLFSQGGISTLTVNGILYLPARYFQLAAVSALCLLLLVYWRHHDQLWDAYWILPGVVMWFSYRSLFSYWVCWAFPMALASVRRGGASKRMRRSPSWKPTLMVTMRSVLVLLAVGAIVASREAPVVLQLRFPMAVGPGSEERLMVDVTNNGADAITPRFAIQSTATYGNPLPWDVEQGPGALEPGESATYKLAASRSDRTFLGRDPVQLVVTDAGQDYWLRGVLNIEPDPAFLWPDMMLNTNYQYWNEAERFPLYWAPLDLESASLEEHDGRQALRLTAPPSPGASRASYLSTSFLYPGAPFGMWLYPPSGGASRAYGLEILDGKNRLWILYGPDMYTGQVDEDVHVIQRTIPAEIWTYQEVDLAGAYVEAGLSLPELVRTYYRGLEIDAQLLRVRLLLTNDGPVPHEAFFGSIVQSNEHSKPRVLMAEALKDPAAYYRRLGQTYERQRNPSRALEAYQRALSFAGHDDAILASIERLTRQLAAEVR